LVLSPSSALTDAQRQQRQQVSAIHPEVAQMVTEVQTFAGLLRERQANAFDDWLGRALQAPTRELRTFARGAKRDYAAVRAAMTFPWSNGPVEGVVNRIKFVKRQMFGRAKFDLLRLRLLSLPSSGSHQIRT
jgi:transposase